jgi:hypothetical protein
VIPISYVPPLLLIPLLAVWPSPVSGQGDSPPDLAAVEMERSRMCTPVFIRLAELEQDLAPVAQGSERIRALYEAVVLEDSARVAPFDASDPHEAAVREWFESDAALALEYLETSDEAVQERRDRERAAIRERLETAHEVLQERAQEILGADPELPAGARACEGVILVRSAVVEACDGLSGPVCEEARAGEVQGRYRFVEAPEDLWDVEQLRPWTPPTPLRPTPQGELGGARTGTLLRRGNIHLLVGLEPMIRER